ncbi:MULTISPECIES: HK97 family phage prohead protease [unclassified Mesorhizobium]|uniref:HK97 family phage prohead protease n=1 Tax=unclassified Mesorhizobium TaxID=325217 RepID=UPI000F761977|nr:MULTISPECIES: HK97 family phage prohead protease [unclassified Mesorhizobium]TGR58267.1 HK97 family phage prohead protease [bacterium M00.F.Ca.ET.199.01.1.1]TGU41625.1 HK97 family phage prohead protease [bacterium M00.F.Ca.ET.156.01.1.1]TGV89751.1 HK97 family phage prohead protease [Mesorhizobium sp. M00.F.Ca.ET.149.01.1.1]AZO54852.1 HK97 family phage prohead protease [Mesorhizobium sp. M8A.F.Ca.ET.057.01.1.1]RWE44165.1 MAG: HK97 family phage prohead protease [Mesorhizobium sp.]
MTNDIERRGGLLGVEARAADGKRTLVGYAAVWNSDTTIGDYFVERIAPGAFSKAIGGDILALYDHDMGRVLGRTRSKTLRLSEDAKGLAVEIDVPDTSDGNDLWTLVERGDVSGMSFAFRATKQEWDDTQEPPHRTILEAELYEVTATANPAYPDTTLAARSLEAAREEVERHKKDAEKRTADATAAARRVAERRASMEQKIRGIQIA